MNQYGAIARQHWKRWRPASYAAITSPETCFIRPGGPSGRRYHHLVDARYGLPSAIISPSPAVAFCARQRWNQSWYTTAARPATTPAVPADVQQAVPAAYLALMQAGTPLSQRAMATRSGLSRRTIRHLVPKSTISGTRHLSESEAA